MKEIPRTDFRWEIISEKSKIDDKPIRHFWDISGVELKKGEPTNREFDVTTGISGQHRLSISMPDKEKNKNIGYHSKDLHFEGDDYNRLFESHSWYIIIGGLGTLLIGILTILEIAEKIWLLF